MKVNSTVDPRDRERLTKQGEEVLALLQLRPRTSRDLALVALNYRARVSELRAAGWDVRCERHESGGSIYTLHGRFDAAQLELPQAGG